jgi:hypothetical protein
MKIGLSLQGKDQDIERKQQEAQENCIIRSFILYFLAYKTLPCIRHIPKKKAILRYKTKNQTNQCT